MLPLGTLTNDLKNRHIATLKVKGITILDY